MIQVPAAEKVRLPQPGGCVCGSVRLALNAAPLVAYACHCHDCQTRSGSAFALTLVVRTADVEVTGAVEVSHSHSPTGRELEHNWCPACRARLFVRATAAPDYMSLRAGVLDDASWIVPVVQMWTESAIPWAVIPGVRRMPLDEALDFPALAREWAATAPEFVTP